MVTAMQNKCSTACSILMNIELDKNDNINEEVCRALILRRRDFACYGGFRKKRVGKMRIRNTAAMGVLAIARTNSSATRAGGDNALALVRHTFPRRYFPRADRKVDERQFINSFAD